MPMTKIKQKDIRIARNHLDRSMDKLKKLQTIAMEDDKISVELFSFIAQARHEIFNVWMKLFDYPEGVELGLDNT